MKSVVFTAIIFLVFSAISFAQINAVFDGECGGFDVNVTYSDYSSGCWDVKIDFLGTVEGKDSFYYVQDALCSPSVMLHAEADTSENFTAIIKLRQNSTIIQSEQILVEQNCPRSYNTDMVLVYSLVITLLLVLGIAYYIKK